MYFKNILLHAAETCTCTKTEESILKATEIKFLRGIVGKIMTELETCTLVGGNTELYQEKSQTEMVWTY